MFTLNCRGKLLTLDQPVVMGIINTTPDSFFEGSRFSKTDDLLVAVEKMMNEGVDILDIGGQSTRPGSEQVTEEKELERVSKAVGVIHQNFPEAIISIDTYRARIAREAVNAGASIINDISAGSLDEEMIETVVTLQVPYVLMHMKGTPETMQQSADYENVTREVLDFFISSLDELRRAGINDVIVDPGFGFGKTIAHNFELLKNLSVFKMLDRPILAGISRKSTVYKTLGVTVEEALNGTTVLHTIALINGANILRVHDVREAKEAIRLVREAGY